MALRLPPPSRPSVRLSVRLCPLASEVNYSVSSTFEWAGRGRAREGGSEASLTLELSYDPIIRLRSDGRTDGGKNILRLFIRRRVAPRSALGK